MTSLKWKEIAELIGLVAILAGIYLVYAEIQQNVTIARAEMAVYNNDKLDQIGRQLLDPEFSVLYLKGSKNPAELNESERQMLNAYYESLFNVMAYEFHNHRLGIFVEYAALPRQVARRYFVDGYGRAYWNVRKDTFIPDVVAIVEEELSKNKSNPQQEFDARILKQLAIP